MRKIIVIPLLILCCGLLQAQSTRQIVQIAGVVMSNTDLTPIPFTNIVVKGTAGRIARGAIADMNGFFSIVTYAGDELVFSSVGFQTAIVKIPDTIVADNYTLYQSLLQDTIDLPVTVIYPWPSKEKFREAFLNLQIPDDDYETARKNITLAEIKERAKYQGMTPSMNYKAFLNQHIDPLYYGGKLSGQTPPNNLLNPFAWAKFFQIWKNHQDAKQKKAAKWYEYDLKD